MENQMDKLQEDYFDFCIKLLQKLQDHSSSVEELALRAHGLREELKKMLMAHSANCKGEFIREMEEEIDKLRKLLDSTSTNE